MLTWHMRMHADLAHVHACVPLQHACMYRVELQKTEQLVGQMRVQADAQEAKYSDLCREREVLLKMRNKAEGTSHHQASIGPAYYRVNIPILVMAMRCLSWWQSDGQHPGSGG